MSPPLIACSDVNLDATTLGLLTRSLWDHSRELTERPPDPDLSPLLELAGVKSYRSFVSGARLVTANSTSEGVRFVPMANGGASGPDRGFRPRADMDVLGPPASDASDAELGALVMRAMDLSI
jgi:hypothetical protein